MIKNNVLIVMVVTLLIAGCSQEEKIQDLTSKLQNKKNMIVESKKIKPNMEVARLSKVTYKGGERNPFEVKAVLLNEKKALLPLNMFSINTLRFVGTVSENTKVYAIIITPDNLTYKVKKGDLLGDHYGKIVDIDQSKIKIMESFTENDKSITQRIVTLQLKDEP